MCFCHNKTFVATKIILVAVPANDSDKLDCPLLLVPASIQFLQHKVSMISHVEYNACDKLDCPLQLVPALIVSAAPGCLCSSTRECEVLQGVTYCLHTLAIELIMGSCVTAKSMQELVLRSSSMLLLHPQRP